MAGPVEMSWEKKIKEPPMTLAERGQVPPTNSKYKRQKTENKKPRAIYHRGEEGARKYPRRPRWGNRTVAKKNKKKGGSGNIANRIKEDHTQSDRS